MATRMVTHLALPVRRPGRNRFFRFGIGLGSHSGVKIRPLSDPKATPM